MKYRILKQLWLDLKSLLKRRRKPKQITTAPEAPRVLTRQERRRAQEDIATLLVRLEKPHLSKSKEKELVAKKKQEIKLKIDSR